MNEIEYNGTLPQRLHQLFCRHYCTGKKKGWEVVRKDKKTNRITGRCHECGKYRHYSAMRLPEPPYPYEELLDNCPVCKAPFKTRANPFCGWSNNRMAYTCTVCMTTEGQEILQPGYTVSKLWENTKIPPVYGDRYITFHNPRKVAK